MRSKSAKKLKRNAEAMTIGYSKEFTRKTYQRLKKVHKSLNKNQK